MRSNFAPSTFDPASEARTSVAFSKFASAFPECRLEWTAERGADELASAYESVGLTFDEFESHKFIRLNQLKRLLDAERLDGALRWERS